VIDVSRKRGKSTYKIRFVWVHDAIKSKVKLGHVTTVWHARRTRSTVELQVPKRLLRQARATWKSGSISVTLRVLSRSSTRLRIKVVRVRGGQISYRGRRLRTGSVFYLRVIKAKKKGR
jgi:hypothetical protein